MTIDKNIDGNRLKSILLKVNFFHQLGIDFRYQSINWHRLISIFIDYTLQSSVAAFEKNFNSYTSLIKKG